MRDLQYLQKFKGNPKKMQGGFWAAASLIVGVAGTVYSAKKAASAASDRAAAEKEAIAAQERAANVRAQQERIKQQREARIARARVIASTASEGIGAGSSGVSGAVSSITSSEASNIGNINVAQSFAQMASAANQRAADAASSGATAQAEGAQWQALSSFGSSIFQQKGGWNSLFGDEVKSAQASGSISPSEFMNTTKRPLG